uniref:Uncharacterized protein n=1 Tax=Amphimedon queenslandica TaxID=400682 RepID=A0A1X7TGL9_AMPQE
MAGNESVNLHYVPYDNSCGEVCYHIAAILFKIESSPRLDLAKLTYTSLPCTINQVFRETTDAAPNMEINFQRPEKLYTNEGQTSTRTSLAVDYIPTVNKWVLLQQLHKVCP